MPWKTSFVISTSGLGATYTLGESLEIFCTHGFGMGVLGLHYLHFTLKVTAVPHRSGERLNGCGKLGPDQRSGRCHEGPGRISFPSDSRAPPRSLQVLCHSFNSRTTKGSDDSVLRPVWHPVNRLLFVWGLSVPSLRLLHKYVGVPLPLVRTSYTNASGDTRDVSVPSKLRFNLATKGPPYQKVSQRNRKSNKMFLCL